MNKLPSSNNIDIGKLSQIFTDTTNSYKYLFFQAILRLLYKNNFEKYIFNLTEIAEEILIIAWYPHKFFKLSLGKQDKISEIIDGLKLDSNKYINEKELIIAIRENSEKRDFLLRYVPYRLLSVFFKDKLQGVTEAKRNSFIENISIDEFDTIKPLYKFVTPNKIEIHQDWLHYLKFNFSIVESWSLWKWLNYLQSRNPNVPAISKKLFPPLERNSLTNQTKYWKSILQEVELNCIYTGKLLNDSKITLDHFLPWSFVGHDQLWNLIPVDRSTNSSKSNNIPDLKYLSGFIEMQRKGLIISKSKIQESSWKNQTEPFIVDLQIKDFNDLLDIDKLNSSYYSVIPPLMQLAKNIGFSCNWKY